MEIFLQMTEGYQLIENIPLKQTEIVIRNHLDQEVATYLFNHLLENVIWGEGIKNTIWQNNQKSMYGFDR